MSTLKIDRSFVRDLATNQNDRRLVEAIVLMAHGLGLAVVAEGVETPAQDTLLGVLSCDLVQGNYYSEPIDADGITTMVDGAHQKRSKSGQAR